MGSIYDALTSCTRFQGAVNAAGRRDNSTQTDLMPILDKGQDSEVSQKSSKIHSVWNIDTDLINTSRSRGYQTK